MTYYKLIIDNKSKLTDSLYTYKSDLDLGIGQKVLVSFGKSKKLKDAYVVSANSEADYDLDKIKSIDEIADIKLSKEIISTVLWMKKRYGIKYIDGINCFLTKGKRIITDPNKDLLKPYAEYDNSHELTQEQELALEQINASIDNNVNDNYLIHGVTSSGKTEVYLQACKRALDQGKTAIVLVPEIALTPQTVERFVARFGKDNIALLHSKLSVMERHDQWMKAYSGKAKIVIGARIGVFAPLSNIGIIIIDEEHESTYKADLSPKYDTSDIALYRAYKNNAVCIFGSATPSLISYSRAEKGQYKLIELKERFNKTPLPEIEIIDMKAELAAGNANPLSRALYSELKGNLEKGKQSILFLNRRGYSNYIACNSCGEILKCPKCQISLTKHKHKNAMVCHYCGRSFDIPTVCPTCGSKFIKGKGLGTERLEEELEKLFPDANIARLDLDTGTKASDIAKILSDFKEGKTDILLGTQLVAKGLDFINVGLVGVISADDSMNIPDYRASERSFQLITQVAGRAGRGKEQGKVLVQTMKPDHYAIKAAASYDYKAFYKQEMEYRKVLNYPPFCDLFLVNFVDKDEDEAYRWANSFREYISKSNKGMYKDFCYEAKESFYSKGQENHRINVLVKCPRGERNNLVFLCDSFRDAMIAKKSSCNLIIDINPYGSI
ncbi:MAG: primosomal protein N' [Clostridia bacterium]|nr:primosomal protein N' [Clostridia bacterium]